MTRPPRVIPLEPHYSPGVSTRYMVLLLTAFCVLAGGGITVIALHVLGAIS